MRKLFLNVFLLSLMAIFIPTPVNAGQKDECLEKLKRLGQMCMLYAQDNNEKMPPSLSELYYRAYITDLDVFACPSHLGGLTQRTEIDVKSSFVMLKEAEGTGAKPILQERSAAAKGREGVYVFFSDGSIRLKTAQGFSKLAEPSPPAIASLEDGKGALQEAWRGEVEMDWFADILVARVNGPGSQKLKKGDEIPSAAVKEVIESMRVVEYRDGMSLGTLMDDRPGLAGKIARVVENSDIIEGTGGKTPTPTIVIRIPLSELRAVIFSSEGTRPPNPQPQTQVLENTWQSIREDDSSSSGLSEESLKKKKAPKGRKTGYGF